jgi:hypothetical protein
MLRVSAGEYGPAAKRTERPVRHLGTTSIDRRSRRIGLASATALVVGALMAVSLGTGGSVRAAGGSVDLDQWATIDNAWQNGNLNGNNTTYPEGGVVPFRLAQPEPVRRRRGRTLLPMPGTGRCLHGRLPERLVQDGWPLRGWCPGLQHVLSADDDLRRHHHQHLGAGPQRVGQRQQHR